MNKSFLTVWPLSIQEIRESDSLIFGIFSIICVSLRFDIHLSVKNCFYLHGCERWTTVFLVWYFRDILEVEKI